MNTSRAFRSTALVFSLVLALAVGVSLVKGSSKSAESSQDFTGKVLIIGRARTSSGVAYLEKAEFQTIRGRLFLVGTVAYPEFARMRGVKMGVAWDSVELISVFDNLEGMKKALEESNKEVTE